MAPASSALASFCTNGHVPRWISAMAPSTAAGKSESSHPLVEVDVALEWIRMSTGTTVPVTVSPAEKPNVIMSTAVLSADAGDEVYVVAPHVSVAGLFSSHVGVVERLEVDVVARLAQGLGDVVDRGVVAGSAGRAGAAVGVGDGLERLEVVGEPAELDGLAELLRRGVAGRGVRDARHGHARDEDRRDGCDVPSHQIPFR